MVLRYLVAENKVFAFSLRVHSEVSQCDVLAADSLLDSIVPDLALVFTL